MDKYKIVSIDPEDSWSTDPGTVKSLTGRILNEEEMKEFKMRKDGMWTGWIAGRFFYKLHLEKIDEAIR